jgi:hypothetical protein
MSEGANDLPPAALAFRVMIFAGVLGAMAWLPSDAHWFAGVALLLVAAAFLYEVWVKRSARRRNLLWLLLSLISAGVLLSGLLSFLATPLLALAAVCGALAAVAMLGDAGTESSE